MQPRRPLLFPILLAVGIIVMLIALTVGWVILSVRSTVLDHATRAPIYWTLLTVGATFFILIVVGVVLYLTLSIKAINLSRRQSNFIDSVTHELKSPIASLKLYLQTLTRRQTSLEERQEFYASMLEDVERLDELINHVLDAAKLDRSSTESSKNPIHLDELLRECAAEVCHRQRVEASTVKLNLNPCVVESRRVDLDLIFRNLLDNAVKYAGTPPEVVVTMHQQVTGRVCVRVSDNGRGIPHESRRKVFRRFVRLGTELEREKPGLGLGLYIVRTLVARLRGHVKVRGRENADGTTVEVLLPGKLSPTNQPLPPAVASSVS